MNERLNECWYKDVCQIETCSRSCVRFLEMSYLMDNSNIPKKRQLPDSLFPSDCDYDAFCRLNEIKKDIVDFVANGRNLYIASSTTGNGKTSWSLKLMLKYFDSVWPGNGFKVRGVFVHVPTFLSKLKDFSGKDTDFEKLKSVIPTVDLVIWDDIASTSMSNYDYSQLLVYIDNRSLNRLSNIYTGNFVDSASLNSKLGSKLSSRIFSSTTEVIEFKGGDRR